MALIGIRTPPPFFLIGICVKPRIFIVCEPLEI